MRNQEALGLDGGVPEVDFWVGIDTHSETHTVAVLDAAGRTLMTGTYPATKTGYQEVVEGLVCLGRPAQFRVGVEGTNSYGAGLSRTLQTAGFEVFEVLRPARRVRRMDGKSDPIDAVEAARTLMSGRGVSVPKNGVGYAESLRYLHAARDKYVGMMTAISNAVLALVVTAPVSLREKYAQKTTEKTIAALAACRPGMRDHAGTDYHVLSALRSMAKTYGDLKEEAGRLEEQMRGILEDHYRALLAVYGVGVVSAADLVVTAGDNPERIRSEAAFAKLCGACPIPASSGKTNRHRLNRGGDRRANRALHRIALVRMSSHRETRAYVEKQTQRGKGKKEILRQLKRFICREIYRALVKPETIKQPVVGSELRAQREAQGFTRPQVAKILGTWPSRISDIERDRFPALELRGKYHDWLQTNQTQVTTLTPEQQKVA